MSHREIFVFKPLSSGLGLDRSHQTRPTTGGLWSGSRARAIPALRRIVHNPTHSPAKVVPSRSQLMIWQRFIAVWCDVMVCGGVAVFALLSAGFFAACLDQGPASVKNIGDVLGSFAWIRQSVQMMVAMTNIASTLPWLPVLGFLIFFGFYRLAVARMAGTSPGETLARWLAGPP